MAGHRRLGIDSPAQRFASEIFQMIAGTQADENKLTLQIAGVLS
jgi:hypothetical protein